jgi:hypothetical protein
MTDRSRGIGPLATTVRVIVAAGLLYVAGGGWWASWDVRWQDVVAGLLVLPGLTLLLGLTARRYAARPLRFTGPGGHALNCAAIVALLADPYTSAAAALFYAAMLVVAAWRGQRGCEITVLSNWILRRDDQVGCPALAPVDAFEARQRLRRTKPPIAARGR